MSAPDAAELTKFRLIGAAHYANFDPPQFLKRGFALLPNHGLKAATSERLNSFARAQSNLAEKLVSESALTLGQRFCDQLGSNLPPMVKAMLAYVLLHHMAGRELEVEGNAVATAIAKRYAEDYRIEQLANNAGDIIRVVRADLEAPSSTLAGRMFQLLSAKQARMHCLGIYPMVRTWCQLGVPHQ
jgi:hypothetical protein